MATPSLREVLHTFVHTKLGTFQTKKLCATVPKNGTYVGSLYQDSECTMSAIDIYSTDEDGYAIECEWDDPNFKDGSHMTYDTFTGCPRRRTYASIEELVDDCGNYVGFGCTKLSQLYAYLEGDLTWADDPNVYTFEVCLPNPTVDPVTWHTRPLFARCKEPCAKLSLAIAAFK